MSILPENMLPHHSLLTRKYSSSRRGIRLEVRLVDIHSIARVSRLEQPWDLSTSSRQRASTAV